MLCVLMAQSPRCEVVTPPADFTVMARERVVVGIGEPVGAVREGSPGTQLMGNRYVNPI